MLELWGIGYVTKEAVARANQQGGENVTIEVNFEEKNRNGVKNQIIKVKSWGSPGQAMKGLAVGTKVLVAGKLEISEYEWQGKPTKSYALAASGFSVIESTSNAGFSKPATQQPASKTAGNAPAQSFSEFGSIDEPEIPF